MRMIGLRDDKALARACQGQSNLQTRALRRHTFTLQWHVTDTCNLSCRHCYQENGHRHDMSLENMLGILEQFEDFLEAFCKASGKPVHGHINLTGGEPFLNRDFLNFLSLLSMKKSISFAILTNGTLLDGPMVARLKNLQPGYVQVSLEGSKSTHDEIRGSGSYERAKAGIARLVAARIPVSISFTAHRSNYLDFPDVVRCGRKLGVTRIWADRLIPCGNATTLADEMLSPEETLSFFEAMHRSGKKRSFFARRSEAVSMHRALQFLVGGGEPYHCRAGNKLLTVLANGDVVPCRRMPVVTGNVFENSLTNIYFENTFMKSLRNAEKISRGCEHCSFQPFCRGGLKCLSYAVAGDPFVADPGCWIADRPQNHRSI